MAEAVLGESQNARDARIEKLFATLDVHKKGCLDLQDLKAGLKKLDHPLKNADLMLKDILQVIDTSKDGKIDFDEFKCFVEATEAELWFLFKNIDRDGNGRLDKAELKDAFKRAELSVSDSKLDEFFSELDLNNDGAISFEEWRDFLLFIPHDTPSLKAVMSYYTGTISVNTEGDVHVSEDTMKGLGYFLSGAIAGAISRTATAPFDRVKVYLIADIGQDNTALEALKNAKPKEALKVASMPIVQAIKTLWRTGGVMTFFAGNGLNVLKVMPESAIKFGTYEVVPQA
jgi:solute carrier family 25 phosphate transporter 23/24/25/41